MDIKKVIKEKDYDFLREDKKLGENIILLTLGGSHAYGTNIESSGHTSDLDLRGIYLNSKEELLGMNCSDKPYDNKDLDVVIYPLKQIVNLLLNVNPNTLELLGTREDQIFILKEEGRILRDNLHLFLSKRAYSSFGGYAIQQLRRLENALARDNYPEKEKQKHILGSIEKQMMTFKDRYKSISTENLNLYVDDMGKGSDIYIDINLKKYPLRNLKGMLNEMNQVVRDYDKLTHRNSKKDELHLLKHSMHLIRLLLMGTEILEGKGVNTYREKDRDLLLDIRNGRYSYEEIFQMVRIYEKEFRYAYDNTSLPEAPDIDKINELVMEINKKVIFSGEGKIK